MEVNWRNELPVPYCVSKKELSLEILFLHTRGETICSFSTSEERPPFRVRIAAYLQASSDLLSCLNYFLPHDSCFMSSTVPVGMRMTDQDRGARVQFAVAARASILLSPVIVTLKVSCAVFLGLNTRRGKLITSVAHSTREIVGDAALKFP